MSSPASPWIIPLFPPADRPSGGPPAREQSPPCLGSTIRACARSFSPAASRRQRAAFLDRDGTLIVDKPYNVDPRQIEILPGVPEALRALQDAGYLLVVVTNQSGIARGFFAESALRAMHRHLARLFAGQRVSIAAFYYCPHHTAGRVPTLATSCFCRKPRPGMLLRAAADWSIDLGRSWMIGDRATDTQAGRAAGCRTVLLGNRAGSSEPTATNLLDAARQIIVYAASERARGREAPRGDLPG